MASPNHLRRTQWLASFVLIGTAMLLLGLLGRVFWLEKYASASMQDALARQNTANIPIPIERGDIKFADGPAGALSVRMYNMYADPAYILDSTGVLNGLKPGEAEKAQEILANALTERSGDVRPLMSETPAELLKKIRDNQYYREEVAPGQFEDRLKEVRPGVYEKIPRRFLWLKKEVDEDFHNRFMELRAKLREESRDANKIAGKSKDPAVRAREAERARVLFRALEGVGFVRSIERVYPLGHLGGSLIGYANRYEGVEGLERQLDFLLQPRAGQMSVTRDAARHTVLIQDEKYKAPDPGRDVWLTVNSVIQGIAEEELSKTIKDYNAESGTAIVLDTHTGAILAMANFPFLNPTEFNSASDMSRRNIAVTDPYEPGSIFKPFVMAYAIEKKIVKASDVLACHGGRWYDPTGRLVTDTHGYGALTVEEVLIKSSNIGMTQIGWKMGIPVMHEGVTKFGFGQRTGVELPGDQRGLVPPLAKWNKGTLTSASFGYAIGATPLQLVRAFATFGNGGYLVTPRIIEAVEETPGKLKKWTEIAEPVAQVQILSPQTCETMRNIMEGVYSERGTARSSPSKVYRLFGKTGTAHVAGRARGEGVAGYGASDYNTSFLCGGPMTNPRVVALVTVHKPDRRLGYFGGTVAAPAATSIVERTLMYQQVPGDRPPAPEKPARRGTGH
jgi:cell division protein FtsI (penicillin-binding protein 3)